MSLLYLSDKTQTRTTSKNSQFCESAYTACVNFLCSSKQVKDHVSISEKLTRLPKKICQHLSKKSKTDDVRGARIFKFANSNGLN